MSRTIKLAITSFVFIFIVSCGGGGGGGSNNVTIGNQTYANTTQAVSLVVAPVGTVVSWQDKLDDFIQHGFYALIGINNVFAQSQSAGAIYQSDAMGVLSQVTVSNLISGNFATNTTVGMIDTPNFVLTGYKNLYNSSGQVCALIGIRKSDSKLACITVSPRCDNYNNCKVTDYFSQVKSSTDGNTLFIVRGEGGLSKVNLIDPWNPVVTDIFTHASVGDAAYPVVNSNGDVFTCINLLSSSTNIDCRIYGANGAMTDVITTRPNCAFFDNSNNFYYSTADVNGFYLNKMTFTNGSFGAATVFETESSSVGFHPLITNCGSLVHYSNRIFGINLYSSANTNPWANVVGLVEFSITSGTASQILTLDANSAYQKSMQAYQTGLAILDVANDGSGIIERFNPSTNTAITVLPNSTYPAKYAISNMTVNPTTGTIYFVGSTVTGGQGVVGTIDGTTNVVNIKNSSTIPSAISTMQ